MLAIQSTTAVGKLPSLLKLLSNGGPLFSCSWTLDHLSSKLGFDSIADFINDEGDGVWSNSEVVGQAWIIVTADQVYLFCFLFSRAGAYRGEGGNRGLCGSGNGCLTNKRERYGHYSTHGAWSNSEAVGQAWIIVTAGQMS
jgi:hypothetical protein